MVTFWSRVPKPIVKNINKRCFLLSSPGAYAPALSMRSIKFKIVYFCPYEKALSRGRSRGRRKHAQLLLFVMPYPQNPFCYNPLNSCSNACLMNKITKLYFNSNSNDRS